MQWEEVKSFRENGKPQSALGITDKILEQARKDENSPQVIKALIHRMIFTNMREEDAFESSIKEIKKEIETEVEPARSILHSILGEMYWQYYQKNRWKISDRTTGESQELDIRTWTAQDFIRTAAKNFSKSIENEKILLESDPNVFDPIWEEGHENRNVQPTLYDVLAHRAKGFFQNREAGIGQPADAFFLGSDKYFSPADDFSEWKITTSDSGSYLFQALLITQKLIRVHLASGHRDALVFNDLERLMFVRNYNYIPKARQVYLNALDHLTKRHPESPVTAEVLFAKAEELDRMTNVFDPLNNPENQWKRKEAKEICDSCVSKYPESIGAGKCQALLDQITKLELNIHVENVVVPGEDLLALVSHRNADSIYLHIVRIPFAPRVKAENNYDYDLAYFLRQKPVRSWSVKLKNEGDYLQHRMEIPIEKLDYGSYAMIASANKGFKISNEHFISNRFTVSNLSYLCINEEDGSARIVVLDRNNGEPLKDVEVQLYTEKYNYQRRGRDLIDAGVRRTGEDGMVRLEDQEQNRNYRIYLYHGQDSLAITNPLYVRKHQEKKIRLSEQTSLFTDRAIYRPGQTIYFKGIALEREGHEVRLSTERKMLVKLMDVNNQEISRLELVTNDYGSYQGSFVIPGSGLTGNYHIDDGLSRIGMRIEEYKHPSFEIEMQQPDQNFRLGSVVQLKGTIQSLNKVPLSGASGKFRVVRKTAFPFHWGYPVFYPPVNDVEIGFGEFECDPNGEFNVSFTAVPDHSVDPDHHPVFHYQVGITATDIRGETQMKTTSVPLGYESLQISLDLPEEINMAENKSIEIKSTNLQGVHTPANITIDVLALSPPDKAYKSRLWSPADQNLLSEQEFRKRFPDDEYMAESQIQTWPVVNAVYSGSFNTDKSDMLSIPEMAEWAAGAYEFKLKAEDPFGKEVIWKKRVYLYNFTEDQMPTPANLWITHLDKKAEPGGDARILIGTSHRKAKVLQTIRNKSGMKSERWLELTEGLQKLDIEIEEEDRGNLVVELHMVYNGRLYDYSTTFEVPYENKKLDVQLSTFRKELKPGDEEEWKLKVHDFQGNPVTAEALVSMYDKSLDLFVPHNWSFDPYQRFFPGRSWQSSDNFGINRGNVHSVPRKEYDRPKFRRLDQLNWFGFSMLYGYNNMVTRTYAAGNQPEMLQKSSMDIGDTESESILMDNGTEAQQPEEPQIGELVDGLKVQEGEVIPVRTDFRETAFFYPYLAVRGGEGEIEFTVPDALTGWKVQALVHTRDLEIGTIKEEVITRKNIMITPNFPRFLSVSDTLEFTARITNLSGKVQKGKAEIEITDQITGDRLNELLLSSNHVEFQVDTQIQSIVKWRIVAPETPEILKISVTAKTSEHTDGEERSVPVISNNILVTETHPVNLRKGEHKSVHLDGLKDDLTSSKKQVHSLTVEFCSNPAWYVVQSLPFLATSGNESCEQKFNRFYSNSLALNIVNSSEEIENTFELWKKQGSSSLQSNLQKNQELKQIVLEETPWLMEAKEESENKANLAMFFDKNYLTHSLQASQFALLELQSPNGGWPWFQGMEDNRFITQTIVIGFGRLDHLGIQAIRQDQDLWSAIQRAIQYLDDRIDEDYSEIMVKKRNPEHINSIQIQYLYSRSLFSDIPIPAKLKDAVNYFKDLARRDWLNHNRYMQAMIALAFYRSGDHVFALQIIESFKEFAIQHDEFGMYWKTDPGYYWHQQEIEQQAMMIEAFDEIADDETAVEEMKIWLLKQKQTTRWKTNKATAEACYALLRRGSDVLNAESNVSVVAGPHNMESNSKKAEPGTGYYKKSWRKPDIEPDMNRIIFSNDGENLAWGAVYYQYFQNSDAVEPAGNAMSLQREIYLKKNTSGGPVLEKLEGEAQLKTGDILVNRLIIRTDRYLEFVHLKDMRPAGAEPVEFLSGMKYQGGASYYLSIRDLANHLYFDRLPRGTYVLEFEQKAGNTGSYTSGIATIQSFYAPEFSAHSEGKRIRIR